MDGLIGGQVAAVVALAAQPVLVQVDKKEEAAPEKDGHSAEGKAAAAAKSGRDVVRGW